MNPDGATVLRDIVYAVRDGFRPLCMDIHLPPDTARAVCIYAHGGGWRRGSRRAGPGPVGPRSVRLFARLSAAGLVVASVDYRLSGEIRFPGPLDDVRAAVRWLGTDPESPARELPLVLFGVSAGGHLAALCGLDPAVAARAVAAWYPVTDLAAMPADKVGSAGARDVPDSREALLLGAPAHEVPELAREASPVSHVHPDAPPFFLLHGTDDKLVPPRQSERLQQALARVGVSCRYEPVPGYDHMFTGMPDDEVETLVDRTAQFLTAVVNA